MMCIGWEEGILLWRKLIDVNVWEDFYFGYFKEYGYVSNIVVIDGIYVFVFFGKVGVFVFDFEGN